MDELFKDTTLDTRVQYIQESEIIMEDGSQECMTDSLEWVENDMKRFITENQDKIKKVYQAIHDGCNDMVSGIPELNFTMREYEDYHGSMKEYVMNCIKTGPKEDLSLSIDDMQEKDKVFFDTASRSCEQSVPDAMKNVEIIIDLKEMIKNIKASFGGICGVPDGGSHMKHGLSNFYCKSTITFCLKMMEAIRETFTKIWEVVEGYEKPKMESARPYKYF